MAAALLIPILDLVITDFLRWQENRKRAADYVPSADEKADYLAYVRSRTTEVIQEEVAAETGQTWADRKPPKPEPVEQPPTTPVTEQPLG